MQTLFFIFSVVIAFGLISYWFLLLMVRNETNQEDELDREMIEEIQFLIDSIRSADYGTKFTAILILGGTVFSETVVAIINFPFTLNFKKSA